MRQNANLASDLISNRKQSSVRRVAHPVMHENVELSGRVFCSALSGLWTRRPSVPRAHALGFAVPPLRGCAADILVMLTIVALHGPGMSDARAQP